MTRTLLTGCLLVALTCATRLQAQESYLSLQFLGIAEETAGGRARGLGIQGVALDDVRTSLALNPGALGGLEQMTFSAVGVSGRRRSTDGVLEYTAGMARFPHVRVALPVFGAVVVHAGFLGMRNFKAEFQLPNHELGNSRYWQRFERDGTLYQVPVGISGSLGSRLRLGFTWDFVLGTVDERWITEGDSIVAVRSRRRDEMTGQTVTLGAVVRPFDRLSLGASWSPQFEIDRNRRTTLEDERANNTALPLRDSSVRSLFDYPQVVRAGATLNLGYAWTIAGDYMWRDWNAYSGDWYEAEAIGSETRYGGGIEWLAQPRVHYRVGVSRLTWPHSLGGRRPTWPDSQGGNRLHETAIHFGFGVDVKVEGGRFDVAVEHAWIGSLDQNGHQERSWRVIISLAGQEIWRRKSPRAR